MSNTDLILEENAQETMIVQPTIQPQQIERGKFRSLTLTKYTVFIHVNRGTNKFMHVAIVANPKIDCLLPPAHNAV